MQAVVKLLLAGEFVSTVDVTEASALIGAAEQNILLRADRMKASLRAMSTAAQVLVADASVPYRNISWSLPGVGTQNVTNKGRFEVGLILTPKIWKIDFKKRIIHWVCNHSTFHCSYTIDN